MRKIIFHLKENAWLYSLLFLGLALRLLYIFIFTTPESYLFSDPAGYDSRALLMASKQHIAFSTYFPPFFHIFLSFIYRPLIWLNIIDWRIKIDIIIFAIFYMVGFWCIYQIVKKLFTKKIAIIILLILIFWYPFLFLNYLIMSENLFFLLLFLGLYILVCKDLNIFNGIILGFIWGLALLCRPIFSLAIPLFLIWGWYYKLNRKALIGFTAVIFFLIASMMTFNFYYTNGVEKSISSNGGVNFAMLWCDAKSIQFNGENYYYWFAPPANENYPDNKRIYTNKPFTNQRYYYKMGLNCIKNNPKIIFSNISSVIKNFNSSLFPTTSGVPYWQKLRTLFKILNIILFFGAIISIFIAKAKTNQKYLYLFGLIVFSLLLATYLQGVGEERYIIPYAPLLMILSIPVFKYLWKKFQ
jgi:4-amino-4-deoxy-L-arabinose transferase-like glycosyltransferase